MVENGHTEKQIDEQTEFSFERGVRQGCPLFPLLYMPAIEVFPESVRCNEKIKGSIVGKTELKYNTVQMIIPIIPH